MLTFTQQLIERIMAAQFALHRDNHDTERFGPVVRQLGPIKSAAIWVLEKLAPMGIFHKRILNQLYTDRLAVWAPLFPELEWVYQKLEGAHSKQLLIDVVAYRLMGERAIRLPLNRPAYWRTVEKAKMLSNGKTLEMGPKDWVLRKQNLEALGFPCSLYLPAGGPLCTFLLEQYADREHGVVVEAGDVVVDAGACWGDTAVYFAHLAGTSGQVFSFEFVPSNIDVFEQNLSLNPTLRERITLVSKPLWSHSGENLSVEEKGPGSTLRPAGVGTAMRTFTTLSIDEFIEESGLQRLDFIKMDIEGAEFEALKGAEGALRRFRPKLAICLYHAPEHFVQIPRYLDSLNLGYRFSLNHFTIHTEETVLFAWPAERSPSPK